MTAITKAQVNDGIAAGLAAIPQFAPGAGVVQSYAAMMEGISETPTIQVYFDNIIGDSAGNNDRATFGGGGGAVVRRRVWVFHIDVYTVERNQIGQDMARVYPASELVEDYLDRQIQEPYFGVAGIKSLKWTGQRVTFVYASSKFAGIRYVLTVEVY